VVDITLNGEARGTDAPIDMSRILGDTPAVTAVRQEVDHFALSVTEPHLALPAILERLRQNQLELASLTTRHASLEDVFVTLTGRHLRDEAAS
jgi:ABC-2 type transport system ATP-binding protein